MAGDLSVTYKTRKTIIELFNADWHDVHILPAEGFTSIGWDFKAYRPTEEEVD